MFLFVIVVSSIMLLRKKLFIFLLRSQIIFIVLAMAQCIFGLKCLQEKDVSGVKIIVARECSEPLHGEIPLCFLKRNVSHGTYIESGCLNSDSLHRGFCYFHYLNQESMSLRECLPLLQEDQELCICNDKDLCNAREEWGSEGVGSLKTTKTFSTATKIPLIFTSSSFCTSLLLSFVLLCTYYQYV